MVLIYFLCYFSGSSSFITVKISGMYLFFLRTKKRSWSCSFSTDWGLEHSRGCQMLFSGYFRMEALRSPTTQPSCPSATRFAKGNAWCGRTLTTQTDPLTGSPKEGIFQPGPAPVSFQNVRCFFLCRTFREKGNNLTLQRASWRKGTVSVKERWDRRHRRSPDWWSKARAFWLWLEEGLFEKVGRVKVNMITH